MKKQFSRRSFVRQSMFWGAIAGLGSRLSPVFGAARNKSAAKTAGIIAAVTGTDVAAATAEAVKLLGGMEKFVPKGSRVAILPNAQRNNPGVFTNPALVRTVIKLCRQAGAKEINCLTWLPEKNWLDTGLAAAVREEGANLVLVDAKDDSQFPPVPVPQGTALKEAGPMKAFAGHDIFINLPITKDHAGNKFTGTLKNMMGINGPKNNRTFHKENWKTDPADIAHLEQCIADLNTILTPTLNIVDATQFIITNGPFGPGELKKLDKVIAGVDRVAIDSYCCGLWGLNAKEIAAIQRAAALGLGQADLSKVKLLEKSI